MNYADESFLRQCFGWIVAISLLGAMFSNQHWACLAAAIVSVLIWLGVRIGLDRWMPA